MIRNRLIDEEANRQHNDMALLCCWHSYRARRTQFKGPHRSLR